MRTYRIWSSLTSAISKSPPTYMGRPDGYNCSHLMGKFGGLASELRRDSLTTPRSPGRCVSGAVRASSQARNVGERREALASSFPYPWQSLFGIFVGANTGRIPASRSLQVGVGCSGWRSSLDRGGGCSKNEIEFPWLVVVSRVDIGEKRVGVEAVARIRSRGDELRTVVFLGAVPGHDIGPCGRPHDVVLERAGLQFIGAARIPKINGWGIRIERGHQNVVAKYVVGEVAGSESARMENINRGRGDIFAIVPVFRSLPHCVVLDHVARLVVRLQMGIVVGVVHDLDPAVGVVEDQVIGNE